MSELYHEQCSRWSTVSKDHIGKVAALINKFVGAVLVHCIADVQVRNHVQHRMQQSLDANFGSAKQELNKLVADEQIQPITYNHYYTDNIQRSREDSAKDKLQQSMDNAIKLDWSGKFHVSNTSLDLEKVSSALKSRIVVDMTQQACIESLGALEAYYKVLHTARD